MTKASPLRLLVALSLLLCGRSALAQLHDLTPAPVEEAFAPSEHAHSSLTARFRVGASLRETVTESRPGSPIELVTNTTINRAQDRLHALPVSAGMDSKKTVAPPESGFFSSPSVFADYNYVNSDDSRFFGTDSDTHLFDVGVDAAMRGGVLVGLVYSHSQMNGDSSGFNFSTRTDSNLISTYAAKRLFDLIDIGFSGGYSHSDTRTFLRGAGGGSTASQTNSGSITPFIDASHKWGALSATLTTEYSYSADFTSSPNNNQTKHTGKFGLGLKVVYEVTEKLKLQGMAKFVDVVKGGGDAVPGIPGGPNIPDSRRWGTFGARISYQPVQRLDTYVEYDYDAFNSTYRNNTIMTGASYAF